MLMAGARRAVPANRGSWRLDPSSILGRTLAAALVFLFLGCGNTLPDSRLMVRSILHHHDGDSRTEEATERGYYVAAGEPAKPAIPAETQAELSDRLRRHLKIEAAISGAPLLGGNKVILLQNGAAAYQAMFAAMSGARNSINLETFIFTDDEVGRQFASLLIAARRRGVLANVIYDGFGSMATSAQFFDRLRRAGVSVVEFNPMNPLRAKGSLLKSVKQRDHRKLLIVDGKIAFTGGINITGLEKGISRASRGADVPEMWRDTDVEIQGPAVNQLQRLFVAHWFKQTGHLLPVADYFPQEDSPGDVMVRVIGSTQDAGFSQMYVTLISAIWHAERRVYITTAYFAPDAQLLRALEQAARRGVDVELILPRHSDYAVARYAAQTHYQDLLTAGVRVYEREDVILHAKTATIDGVWSTVGSTNLDWLSFASDDEINVTILDPEFAQRMERAFAADREQSRQITLQAWERRSCRVRVRDWLASTVETWL
jgi:cardiolipin synthase